MESAGAEEELRGVAIIGMSGRFPGAANVEEFWRNLRDGVESIRFFSDEELLAAGVSPREMAAPNYVKANGVLEDIELFDAPFFGFSPREAEIMDPQLRFFLEGGWEALENAGYNSDTYPGAIGIYGGMHMSKYLLSNLLPNRALVESAGALQLRIWNDKDFLASLVAYKLNLQGPSVTVQTACSTSLVAVCMACQSLLNYQCDMALAGGVTVSVPHYVGAFVQEGVLSPDGHCRAFDAEARGTVAGNGMGIVLLKRLSDAIADRDPIYAVVKGWAMNNDGSAKIGYTAPSMEGQMEVIGMAQALAEVEPETVTYIEAHGTGTPLGDPIEIAALNEVFRTQTEKKGFCGVGSVKTNIGHLDAAAGVASLIKTVLALRHKQLPPSINFQSPNPQIDFANSPFYVNARLSDWKSNGTPLRAGVSSFAMGGVNAHVILEEAPPVEESSDSRPYQLLVLSAKSNSALDQMTKNLAAHLRQQPGQKLSDVAYTLKVGRRAFIHRRTIVCSDTEDAVSALETLDPKRVFTSTSDTRQRNVVFMFPGQGAQYVQMAAGLYEDEPTFRQELDRCAEALRPALKLDLRELLYPAEEAATEAAERLGQTQYTQPALFAVEYALAKVWMQWGVEPKLMIGHSVGEYVAACLSGVMSLEDALSLVAERARLMQELPPGAMLAVSLTEERVQPLLGKGLSLAAVNSHALSVVSGLPEMIEKLQTRLTAEGIECRRLHTSHAFHSEMVEPIMQQFINRVRKVRLQAPSIPYVSNVTGELITEAEATDPLYWAKHLRRAVRFADGLNVVLQDEQAVLIEVGPGRALSTFCKHHPQATADHLILASVRHPHDAQADVAFLLNSLGRLWLTGFEVDWDGFYAEELRNRVPLPSYPFERHRYWVEPQEDYVDSLMQARPAEKRLDIAEWFYTPLWKQSFSPRPERLRERLNWLLFIDELGLGEQIAGRLKAQGQDVVLVRLGDEFNERSEREFTINPERMSDYETLLLTLAADGHHPHRVIHLWNVNIPPEGDDAPSELFRDAQIRGSHSLLRLADALAARELEEKVTIIAVSNNLQAVAGFEHLMPEKAPLLGACHAIACRAMVVCRSVDVSLANHSIGRERVITQILSEFMSERTETIVAYRGNRRWTQSFEEFLVDGANEEKSRLREGGAYLFLGDLSPKAIGLAQAFVEQVGARIALMLAPDFPEREEWERLLAEETEEAEANALTQTIRALRELEAAGIKALLLRGEMEERNSLEKALVETFERFGELNGVVYTAEPLETEPHFSSDAHFTADERLFESSLPGLMTLSDSLHGRNLDFCLLQSPLSTLLCDSVSQVDSAAAHFIENLATLRSQAGSTYWVSVQWEGWPVNGANGNGHAPDPFEMTQAEAFQVVRRALSTEQPHLLISTADLHSRLEQQVAATITEEDEPLETPTARGALHHRPELAIAYVAPRSEDEELLAGIWKQFLGFEQVGIHDNFFDLGGHSLLATQLVSRIRSEFDVSLPLETLFAEPTVAGLVERIHEARLEESTSKPSLIPVSQRDKPLPLSFAQQRMWFFDQLESSSSTYNIPLVIRVGGALDVEALERSLNDLVARHEILRTTYTVVDETPVQLIASELKLSVPLTDVSDIHESERDEQVQQLIKSEAREPFSLSTGPLLRMSVLRLKEEDYVLMLTLHHVLADGWSMGVMVRELEILYQAHLNGKTGRLPELPIQYADYAVWQREMMQGEELETQLDYWKRQLADLPDALDLPTDRPRPSKQTFRGALKTFTIDRDVFQPLQALNCEEGTTLYMLLLAAYQTLLHRYTNQSDIVVGSAIAGRNRAELEGLIGFFVNTLVMRTDLSGDPSFRKLLGRVREVALQAYAHPDVPFEQLVEVLQPVRDPSRPPLFQTMLILQNGLLRSQELSGLTFGSIQVDREASMFDLTLYFNETEEGLSATVEYNTDLFDEGTIERLAGHFEQLLTSIAANPDQSLSRLSLLTHPEAQRLLVEWNSTTSDYPRDLCIHELFEQQAEATPDAVAVISASGRINYRDLNQRANQLAHYLRRQGVGADVPVAICLERSIEMVVGLLGILKAGGAYVPLDPAYPQERLAFMLEDSGASVLLTEQSLEVKPAERDGLRIVYLDADRERIALESRENPSRGASAENLAYVIYTSGSTGTPKGVMGLHRGMVNRFRWMWEEFPFEAGEVCCQKTSLSFLDSAWEIFGTMSKGVPVRIIKTEVVKDVDKFVRTLAEENVTRIVLVPSLLRLMLDSYPDLQERLPRLKYWVSSGEALSFELAQKFKQHMRESVLLNLYGSSEVSADSTFYDASSHRLRGSVPIGRPIANTDLYILDPKGQPVPTGIPGELYIGGDGLARGYWRRAELTADKFVPNHLGLEPGARMFRTGDLARYLPDGTIDYLGRVDHQVKIRGQRLELGEIEAVLNRHPLVSQSVIVAQKDSKGEQRLVAYVVGVAGEQLEPGALRQSLRERLPEYMVPSVFVLLDQMPLTPNGKVNRRALPAPDDAVRPEQATPFVKPETQTEIDLANIWSEVLGGKQVGVNDNFFDLGGHSLLATQLISRVRTSFGLELPLSAFLASPTIKSLAEKIEEILFLSSDSTDLDEVLKLLEGMDDDETQEMLTEY